MNAIIERQANGLMVGQRESDGYVNATRLCQAAGKKWNDYYRLDSTKAFLDELSMETGIPASNLIEVRKGKPANLQGTWIHPYVAVNLGQWLSAKFAVQVAEWVFEWMSKGQTPAIAPQKAKLPDGLLNLVARIEKRGEELHTAHHRLMTDVRELVEVVRTTYNDDARKEFCELLRRAAEQIEKAALVTQTPKLIEQAFIMNSTQTGCLERYTPKRKNKVGEVVVYPKINAAYRDEAIDSDWQWRYRYSVKDSVTGEWKAKSKSVKLDKLPAVRAAISLDATLPTILRLIEE
jgi:hypothetical protein